MLWRAVLAILMVSLLLASTASLARPADALSLGDVDDKIKGFFEGIIEKIKGLFTGIIDEIKNGIVGAMRTVADGLKNILKTLVNTIKAPFEYLVDAFKSSYEWCSSHLGPLAPLPYALIAVTTAFLIFKLVKRMSPVPL